MKFSNRHLFVVLISMSFGVKATTTEKDLSKSSLNSILEMSVIQAEEKAKRQAETEGEQPNGSTPIERAPPKSHSTKTNPFSTSKRGIESPGITEYSEKVNTLLKVLENTDHPKSVLELLVEDGTLALSPNDIFILRLSVELVEQARKKPLVESQVINDQYPISGKNRYATHSVFINESGTTMIEFLDMSGAPWPIHDFSPVSGFKVEKSEVNTLWISSEEKYKASNMFIMLKDYDAPLQFNLTYKMEMRHGLASFKVPQISPINPNLNGKADTSTIAHLKAGKPLKGVNYLDQTAELGYLAETGSFKQDSVMGEKASRVLTSDSSLAEIWVYEGKFLIRSPYILLEGFESVENQNGHFKVYVTSNLNSSLDLSVNGADRTVYVPDSHLY